MIYLDTHIVLWLYGSKKSRLSQESKRVIDRADSVLISPAVELELEFLHDISRYPSPDDILPDLRGRIGLTICDLPFPLVTHEARQIGWTRDVFDRLIVAQASATNSSLVTADAHILTNYPRAVW